MADINDEKNELGKWFRAVTAMQPRNNGVPCITGLDKTYKVAIKKYMRWVDLAMGFPVAGISTYSDEDHRHRYFKEIVSKMTLKPANARKHFLAIKKLYCFENNVIDVPTGFECNEIKGSLLEQKKSFGNFVGVTCGALTDPYSKLPTNVVTLDETLMAMKFVLERGRTDFCDTCLSWTLGTQQFLRGASSRVLTLRDIIWDLAHGPQVGQKHKGMFGLALRAGPIHKDIHTSDRVVGAWRHREVYCCSAGFLCMSLFYRLNTVGCHISFDASNSSDDSPLFWQNFKLVGFKNYDEAYKAVTDVLKKCNISSSKVTHLRKSGVDYGASRGLSTAEISTISKHVTPGQGKCNKVYMPKLLSDLLHVMAGFNSKEQYEVPRSKLFMYTDLPWSQMEIVKALFPNIEAWANQVSGAAGDQWAQHFIENVLPNVCFTVVQDGIYWVKDYPRHPVSQLIIARLQGFCNFASNARRVVEERTTNLEETKLDAMGEASRAAFVALQYRIDASRNEINQGPTAEEVKILKEQLDRIEQRQIAIFQAVTKIADGQQTVSLAPPRAAAQARSTGRVRATGTSTQLVVAQPGSSVDPRQAAHRNQRDATIRLLPAPRGPGIDGRLPKKFEILVNEHIQLDLERYALIPLKTLKWGSRVAQAYVRRRYLFKYCRSECEKRGVSIEAIGVIVDNEVKQSKSTLRIKFDSLKKEDEKTIRRERRSEAASGTARVARRRSVQETAQRRTTQTTLTAGNTSRGRRDMRSHTTNGDAFLATIPVEVPPPVETTGDSVFDTSTVHDCQVVAL